MVKYIDSKLGSFTTYYQSSDVSNETNVVVIQETTIKETTRTNCGNYESESYTLLCVCSENYTNSYDFAISVQEAIGDIYDDTYNTYHIMSMLADKPINIGLNKNNKYEYAINVDISYEVN